MSQRVTRRSFLGTSGRAAAGIAAGLTAGPLLRSGQGAEANERFGVALIGCGGMGRYKLGNFMDTGQCEVVALCDVDPSHAEGAAQDVEKKRGKTPQKEKDYRRVLDRKDVDAVIIATPDHWHAAPMIAACAAGKDVYCEKPCCHNIREGRLMVEAAKKYKRVVQVGTHQRSIPHIQEARRFIQEGKLGLITMTNTFTYGNEFPNGMGSVPAGASLPEGVDYDMWLGPAPQREFNPHRFHGSWRWFFDYASGMVGDWNVHLQDIIMWTMDTPAPISVSTIGGKWALRDDRDTPDTMQTVYEFGPCKLAPEGYVHTYTMRKASGKPWDAGGYGMEFHGTNGMLRLTRSEWKIEADREDWKQPNSPFRIEGFRKEFPGADGEAHLAHVRDFLAAVRTRGTPIASIERHYNTVTACHLANVSLRCGHKVFWDAEKAMCFCDRELRTPDEAANRFLSREYRKGYELPEV